jgi:hypothetical protein
MAPIATIGDGTSAADRTPAFIKCLGIVLFVDSNQCTECNVKEVIVMRSQGKGGFNTRIVHAIDN